MPRPSDKLLAEGFFDFKKQAGPGMCWVKGCQNRSRGDRCFCHKHEMRRWRQKKKAGAAYHHLRHNARSRGIEFTLTPDYFHGLADAFALFDRGGDKVLTIDRVNPALGYVPGNCRVVSLSENVIKGNKERYLPEHVQAMLLRKRDLAQREAERYLDESRDDDDELPF